MEFFASLKNLCRLHQWDAPDVAGLPFPQNIAKVMAELSGKNFDGAACMLLQDKGNPARLATVKTFDTQYRLYYIPVRPLWKMKNNPEQQAQYKLTRAVFSYLYNAVDIPYFREPCYLDNTYDALENWIREVVQEHTQDEEDKTYSQRQLRDFKEMQVQGDALLPEIKQPVDLKDWQQLLKVFKIQTEWDKNFHEVVTEIYKLAFDYPQRNIRHSMHYDLVETAGEDMIYWENYLSFYWSGEDSLNEMLFDMVNNELQEMGYQEEPMAIQWYDTTIEKVSYDFDFETRLFWLLNELTALLNDLDYEEPNK
ncbi:hypothetical protein SNE25_04075 [Mucilaginibacter sabulilitoris]|uniref:Uncharacterized protein n=1 Tax=Mucilaginibacter sabulilitoris TaxID=1173583 RepID=A0ABZ0TPG9_9SPHI|nr:hypothetical protein [Mucilaginibacter sabulilitoris]WPU94696.1 hypothetical protein SNE25_04075 [Mucilaginibacter sabulilitoris]